MHTFLAVLATAEGEAAQPAPGGNVLTSLLPFLVLGLVFYFLIIRPQRNRQKQQKVMLNQVNVGDEIVTIGGIHGIVADLGDDTLELELAPGTVVTLSRQAIGRVITPPAEDAPEDADAAAAAPPAEDDVREADRRDGER